MLIFISENKFFLLAALAAGLFLIESLRPLYESHTEPRKTHIIRNFAFAGINVLLFGFGYGYALSQLIVHTNSTEIGMSHMVSWPYWLETFLIIFILDFALYLWHIASHKVPFLWRFHKVHHSDLFLDFSSASRFHIGELVISACIRLGLVILLGADILQVVLFEFLVSTCAQFNHANIRLPHWLEPKLRRILVTPEMHHIHHSDIQKETDSNYCTTLSLWDYLFGTFHWRDDIDQIKIGLQEHKDKKDVTLKKIITMPFK